LEKQIVSNVNYFIINNKYYMGANDWQNYIADISTAIYYLFK